ncbi:hypothetical protein P7K49_005819, partial [Saguinus oedipus]
MSSRAPSTRPPGIQHHRFTCGSPCPFLPGDSTSAKTRGPSWKWLLPGGREGPPSSPQTATTLFSSN